MDNKNQKSILDTKERKAQTAVGLEKEFSVSFLVPITAGKIFHQEVRAVSEIDAEQQVLNMIKMKTANQLYRDVFPNGNHGLRDLKIDAKNVTCTIARELNSPRMMESEESEESEEKASQKSDPGSLGSGDQYF